MLKWHALLRIILYIIILFMIQFGALVLCSVYLLSGGVTNSDAILDELLTFMPHISIAYPIICLIIFNEVQKIYNSSLDKRMYITEMSFKRHATCVLIGIIAYFIVSVILGSLLELERFESLRKEYEQHMQVIQDNDYVLMLASIVFVAPIFEEILFRGLILSELRLITNERLAIILQACLFAIVHFELVQSVYAFALGLFLAVIYLRERSILAAITTHMTFNAIGFFLGRS